MEVRDKVGLKAGDLVVYEVRNGVVTLKRGRPFDVAFHAALSSTLDEWASPEDDEAFRALQQVGRRHPKRTNHGQETPSLRAVPTRAFTIPALFGSRHSPWTIGSSSSKPGSSHSPIANRSSVIFAATLISG